MKMELPIFEKKMFRRSLVAVRDWGMNEDNIEDNISNESVDLFASFDTAPASLNTERFLELMEAVKTFSNSIRDGFPQELLDYLKKPEDFKIVPAANIVETQIMIILI